MGVLGSGVLTGKYNNAPPSPARTSGNSGEKVERRLDAMNSQKANERNLKITSAVVEIAKRTGLTPQVALAWFLTRPASIVPILGARRLSQIRDNLNCLNATLTEEHLRRLDEVSRIDLGFPHDFYADPIRRDRLFGGTHSRIADHRGP